MMKRMLFVMALVAGCCLLADDNAAQAGPPGYCGYSAADAWMYWYAHQYPWHGQYRHTATGKPVSLVVPPIANLQTHYRWGVPSTTVTPIHHQYGRSYPGDGGGYAPQFRSTPYWPSNTGQFGVYYVRAPW